MTDEQTGQATHFNASDVADTDRHDGIESRRNHYSRLAIANSLDWNGSWRDEDRATIKDNRAIVEAIASQLELTDYQQERALRELESIPRELLGAYESAMLALCLCGVIARRDGRDYHPNHTHPNSDRDSDFVRLFDETSATYSQFYSCWKRVSYEI